MIVLIGLEVVDLRPDSASDARPEESGTARSRDRASLCLNTLTSFQLALDMV